MDTVSLFVEVYRPSIRHDFYNPAPERFRAFPRTKSGVQRALKRLEKAALDLDGVTDFRIAAYEGRKETWNSKPFIGYMERNQIAACIAAK